MSYQPYLGSVMIASFNFAPKNFALCNGQLLPINQNQALFSLLGTQYGGDGRVTFALPNLQGRSALHMSGSLGFTLGQTGGSTSVTFTLNNLPAHSHAVAASAAVGTSTVASAHFPAAAAPGTRPAYYDPSGGSTMNPAMLSTIGSAQPQAVDITQPYLTLIFCIALAGVFPTRN